jgi:hypothetical protein
MYNECPREIAGWGKRNTVLTWGGFCRLVAAERVAGGAVLVMVGVQLVFVISFTK